MERQLSSSPDWSVHCHHNLQICTCVRSVSSRRSQTWAEGFHPSCGTLAFKKRFKKMWLNYSLIHTCSIRWLQKAPGKCIDKWHTKKCESHQQEGDKLRKNVFKFMGNMHYYSLFWPQTKTIYSYHTPRSKSYTQISSLGRKTSSSAIDCREHNMSITIK